MATTRSSSRSPESLIASAREDLDDRVETLAERRVADRREHLDAPVEVALHQVGGAEQVGSFRATPEAKDPRVLEEPTDEQAAHAPDDELADTSMIFVSRLCVVSSSEILEGSGPPADRRFASARIRSSKSSHDISRFR